MSAGVAFDEQVRLTEGKVRFYDALVNDESGVREQHAKALGEAWA